MISDELSPVYFRNEQSQAWRMNNTLPAEGKLLSLPLCGHLSMFIYVKGALIWHVCLDLPMETVEV